MEDREHEPSAEIDYAEVRRRLQAELSEIARHYVEVNASLPRAGIAAKRFVSLLQTRLWPVLKAQGFRRRGQSFRRKRGVAVHMLRFGASNVLKEVRVNLGIHLTFLPPLGGGDVPMWIEIPDCAFQRALGADDDHSTPTVWRFGIDDDEASRTIDEIVRTYNSSGVAYFDDWGTFPGRIATIQIGDIDRAYAPPFRYPTTPDECALTLTRFHAHRGDVDAAERFAKFGLSRAGNWMTREFAKHVRTPDGPTMSVL